MSTFAFCEPSWATTRSLEHIREVLGAQLKTGGGIHGTALCGFDIDGGWDIPTTVTEQRVSRGLDAEHNPTCRRCAVAWAEAIQPTPEPEEDDRDR
jgi:hypothetical protein